MKKYKFKLFFIFSVLVLCATVITVYSCEKPVLVPQDVTMDSKSLDAEDDGDAPMPQMNSICGKIQSKFIISPHGQKLGEALVYNDKKYFYVYLATKEGIFMRDVYLHVANKMEEIPLDENEDPFYKVFKYQIVGKSLSNIRKLRVSLRNMEGVSLVTVTAQTINMADENPNGEYELSWVDGRTYGKTIIGRVFTYEKQVCKELPMGEHIE